MKHIDKGLPIQDFVDFIKNEHPTKWDDIHHSKLHPNLYHDCRNTILVNEQNGIGGYTERPLMDATDLHIDHYRKKGMNWPKDVTFDWDNFVVESRSESLTKPPSPAPTAHQTTAPPGHTSKRYLASNYNTRAITYILCIYLHSNIQTR